MNQKTKYPTIAITYQHVGQAKTKRDWSIELNMGLKKLLSFFPHRDYLHCQHLEVVDKLVDFRMSLSPVCSISMPKV